MTAARGLLHDEGLIDWGPLERLVKATPDSRNMVAGDYMWMGAVELVDGHRLGLSSCLCKRCGSGVHR